MIAAIVIIVILALIACSKGDPSGVIAILKNSDIITSSKNLETKILQVVW